MRNQNEQLTLFTEQAFEPRDIEQAELMKAKANLDRAQASAHYIGNDCFYYLCAGNCVLHGDAWRCDDCDDYKSINDDEVEDDD